jgi:hypothetical protein
VFGDRSLGVATLASVFGAGELGALAFGGADEAPQATMSRETAGTRIRGDIGIAAEIYARREECIL